jgi:hypothetical protein
MMKNEIIVYNNLSVNYDHLLAWTREDSFPIKNISQDNLRLLKSIISVFIIFEGNQGKKLIINNDVNIFDKIFTSYTFFIEKFLSHFKGPSYLLITENNPEQRNKIRSYKGLLPKEIKKKSSYIEVEVPLSNNDTIIIAIIELGMQNSSELITNFLSNTTSCIFNLPTKNIFSEDFLMSFPIKYMSHSGTSTINFLSLIVEFCNKNVNILRVGGDGGDQELSFQIFCKEDKKDLMILQAEKALEYTND